MEVVKTAGITPAQIETLAQAGVIPTGTPPAQVEVFAESCRQHGLSPFKKEIYLVAYNTKNGTQYHTIVGIDGLQQKAARTGRFAGVDMERFNEQSDGTYKTAAELKAAKELPISCTVTVWAIIAGIRCPFTATVLFAEYYPSVQAGRDNYSKAATMPFNMIAKCARAKALKMAFSDELSGLHIEEEKAAFEDTTIQAAEIDPAKGVDLEALQTDIEMCSTIEMLTLLYKSNPAHKAHAAMFTQRANEIKALDAAEKEGEDE
jgi:phage recombination protein Bet